jgi:hypothetical protein
MNEYTDHEPEQTHDLAHLLPKTPALITPKCHYCQEPIARGHVCKKHLAILRGIKKLSRLEESWVEYHTRLGD